MMKTKIIISSLILTLAFFSCKKNDEQKQEVVSAQVDDTKELFKVSLDLLIKKNDTLHLYFTEDGTTNFNEESSIWLPVEGKEVAQEVTFNLPKNVIPTQLRIDLGVNSDQDPIVINRFKMLYFDKTFETSGDLFYLYFDADLQKTNYDKITKTVSAVIKDGVRQSPSFYPHVKPLGDEINKLVK